MRHLLDKGDRLGCVLPLVEGAVDREKSALAQLAEHVPLPGAASRDRSANHSLDRSLLSAPRAIERDSANTILDFGIEVCRIHAQSHARSNPTDLVSIVLTPLSSKEQNGSRNDAQGKVMADGCFSSPYK